jgi:glucose-1-phosphate adenylyltransferase
MPSLNDVLAMILGGGRGVRLYPLTKLRSKPAVPLAGKYRLIDIPISNCINSGIHRMAVLTQFNSVSLHRHIANTYNFDVFHTGWVQVWAAEQTFEHEGWYQGTADAVRKQIFQIQSARARYVLILAGDHLYRMDYSAMAEFHWQHNADITVAVQPVTTQEVSRLGVLKRDAEYRITSFAEKPKDPAAQAAMISRDDPERPFLGSMGIYLFKTEVLIDLLSRFALDDFGSDIIPKAISTHAVYGFDFNDYWADIGTMRSFYETNLALASPNPPFNLFDPLLPIYTHARFLPGSRVDDSQLHHVLLAEGCYIQNAEITHSVIGLRSQIQDGVKIKDCILMGCDYYDTPEGLAANPMPLGVGVGCQLEGAIIDKNARLGSGVVIRPFPRGTDIDSDLWSVRDGIVVIPKNTTIQPRTLIGPGG